MIREVQNWTRLRWITKWQQADGNGIRNRQHSILFDTEGEWCRIVDSNQKPVCNICSEEGHRRSTWPQISSFKCGQAGNIRPNCPNNSQENDYEHATNGPIAKENNENKDCKDTNSDHEEPTEKEHPDDPDDDNYSHSDTEQSQSICAKPKLSTSTLKRERLYGTDSSSEEEYRTRRPRSNPSPNVKKGKINGRSTAYRYTIGHLEYSLIYFHVCYGFLFTLVSIHRASARAIGELPPSRFF